jgi:hypothetical protein
MEILGGVRCHDKIFINNAGRIIKPNGESVGTIIAHELGHVLRNSNDHEDGTLMSADTENETDILTELQCSEARTNNSTILDSQL